ncbi:hypothetical protein LQW54_009873 [Pestalotiopsis sp. IQ-011]
MPAGATREVVYGRVRSLFDRAPREVRDCSDLDPDEDFDFLAPKPEQLSSPPLAMSGSAKNHDIFAKLPSEIILLVIENIPTPSLSSLRHASRSVAAASQPELLDQSFWHSRFQDENEMAFVFANREFILPAPPVDWRQLYCCATQMLRNESSGLGNRRRIWHILDHEMPLLELRLKNESNITKGPYQDDDKVFPGQWSPMASGEVPNVHESMGRDMQESMWMSELKSGYRVFEKQVLDWTKDSASENVILAVTFLHHPAESFISGMRLMCGGGLDTEELSRVGYIKVDDEKEVIFRKRDTLAAISVRLGVEGIIGMCFYMEGDDGEYTQEFGDFSKTYEKSGVAQIHCGETLDKVQFLLELDAWKLVSIRLSRVESNSDVKASVVPVSLAEIWSPALPLKRCPQWISPETNAPRGFSLCMYADLGGADGELLKSVTMVTFFMGRYPRVFLGMGVSYKDGSERLFGNKSYRSKRSLQRCLVQTFVIAGEDGERIQEVTTERCRSHDVICGISLRTNFDRRKVFRFEGLFYDNSYTTTTVAPAGRTFSGFFLKFKYSAGEMRDIVANITETTAEVRPRLKPVPDLNWDEAPAPGEDPDPGWRDGHLFAKARLSGVRRIHLSSVSSGALAPHSGPSYITGMRLDYFDGNGPTILGQWLKPRDTLELVPGETITEVSIEHAVANRYTQRQKFGALLGMEIVTSKGRKVGKTEQPPSNGDAVRLKFTENPYEVFDTITWSCDNLHDHVRIQYARNTGAQSGNGDLYLAVPLTYPDGKFRQSVVEKIFLKGKTRCGVPDSVVAVEVTFKSLSDEPSSLSFLLESGSVRSLGTRRERPVVQQLEAGERLARIDAGFFGTEQKIASISSVCGIFLFNARFMRNGDALALKLVAALIYLIVCRLSVLRVPRQRLIVRRMSVMETAALLQTSWGRQNNVGEGQPSLGFDMGTGSTRVQGVLGSGCFVDEVAPDATAEERAFQDGGGNNIE